MANSVEINARELIVFLNNLTSSFDASGLFGDIGTYLVQSILTRTDKGIDFEGQSFMPYSKSYAKVREADGKPTDHVDLFFSGQMLQSLTYDAGKHSVKLFFMNTPRQSYKGRKSGEADNPAVAFYVNELREFFAISKEEAGQIMDMVDEYFYRVMLESH